MSYDSLGRTTTQTRNVNGNYNGGGYMGAGFLLFSKLVEIDPALNGNFSSNTNFINGKENVTKLSEVQGSLEIKFDNDTVEFTLAGNYDYNMPSSTLNEENNRPYSEQQYSASFGWKLPAGFKIRTTAQYNIYSKRTAGYNINYLLWNAPLSKTFFKNESLIASIDAVDMLNQNTNTKRTVQDNVITDTKTNIVGRYVLLKLTWKFNSNKEKDDEDEMF